MQNYRDEFSPVFKSQYDAFFLTLKNLNYNSKITNRVENRVENRVVKKSDEMVQRYKDIKEIIKDNPNVRKREIAEILGLSRQKVDRAIAHLQEQGELTREGSDKNGIWILINQCASAT